MRRAAPGRQPSGARPPPPARAGRWLSGRWLLGLALLATLLPGVAAAHDGQAAESGEVLEALGAWSFDVPGTVLLLAVVGLLRLGLPAAAADGAALPIPALAPGGLWGGQPAAADRPQFTYRYVQRRPLLGPYGAAHDGGDAGGAAVAVGRAADAGAAVLQRAGAAGVLGAAAAEPGGADPDLPAGGADAVRQFDLDLAHPDAVRGRDQQWGAAFR